ncbi:DUF2029 domain-containing protein [Clostridium sp. YIM B02505]|uniref:DUF2029 domain-containing protein n=1 Tax=Clostridium yunnanense TaxID=2800325 RepID=A0ABS1EIC3_9CLOT|nr:glycosyltransferase 87 family protein [Clostridium yunnanense]MBK1809068.1 DUF2029 domain-containing protein [Clostridium yunnanense]
MKKTKNVSIKFILMIKICLLAFVPTFIYVFIKKSSYLTIIDKVYIKRTDLSYLEYVSFLSVIFFIFAVLGYYLFIENKAKLTVISEKRAIIIAGFVALILRVILANLVNGHTFDIGWFTTWSTKVSRNFTEFYVSKGFADYPPLYMYVLFVIGKLNSLSFLSKYYILVIKLPAIISDLGASYLVYRVAKKYSSIEISAFIALFYLFNPATIINSCLWGQVDSVFTILIVLAIYFIVQEKLKLSSVMFALSVLMKPQGIVFLPVMFFELVRRKKIKNFGVAILTGLIVTFIVIFPFNAGRNLLWILELYKKTITEYPYITMNAFNLYFLFKGNFLEHSKILFMVSYHSIGMIFIVLTTLFSWFIYYKGNKEKYSFLSALIQIVGVFTLSVGMHERYLYPAVIISIFSFIYLKDKRFFILSIGFSITSYINTHTVLYDVLGGNISKVLFDRIGMLTAVLNIILIIFMIKISIDNILMRKKIINN